MIRKSMKYNNFNEFCAKARDIKKEYDLLSVDEIYIYKMYVYSHTFMNLHKMDIIWEFLNEPVGSCYYVTYEMLLLIR